MHQWHWQTWGDAAYLTCSLLADWPHGFFTRAFAPKTPEVLVQALSPTAAVYRGQQVHGNQVLALSEIPTAVAAVPGAVATLPERPPADGMLTDAANQSVWVCSADCSPVLIAHCKTGQVAAVHAGWRGTAQRIVPAAAARLLESGSVEDLRVVIGPAIAGEVYQVSSQVGAEVGATVAAGILSHAEATSAELLLSALQALENPPILSDAEPGRVRLDVRRINLLQLQQMGLQDKQIAIAPHCTYQDAERFFSYRRTRQKQVQWSGIVSR